MSNHIPSGIFGSWLVKTKNNETEIFYDKRKALIWASEKGNADVSYCWHNSVWENFDRNKLGKRTLKDLYRDRAQQLRDTYDHLALHYSGGADSHNVLMTFLNNNIHLDHVYVSWPKKIVGTSLYTPNTEDVSAKNILSEWDFSIEPTLKWLSQTHPKIKIEVGDWVDNLNENYYNKDDNFLKCIGWWNVGGLLRNSNKSKISQEMLEKGKKVASIYGFDKPCLTTWGKEKSVGMCFFDTSFMTASNVVGRFEPFYWSPKLPELPFEMAFQMFLYYDENPDKRQFIRQKFGVKTIEEINEFNNNLTNYICYKDTWPFGRFQANKPTDGKRRDRDSWIHNNSEFKRIVDSWSHHYDGFLQGIDRSYFSEYDYFSTIMTPSFRITRFLD